MHTNFTDSCKESVLIQHAVTNKIRGAVVGAALGDAIGLYTEFLNKSMSENGYPDGKFSLTGNITHFINDSHRNKFTEGSWTDDTDHTLLIILSYLHSNGTKLSSQDFASRLRIWIEQGLLCLGRLPLGIGQATGSVVTRKSYLDDPKAAAYESWKNSGFNSAPNGSLMRTYPLGIMTLNKNMKETFVIATDYSLVTHSDPRCTVACCIATAVMRGILRGEISEEAHIDAVIEEAVQYVEHLSMNEHGKEQGAADVNLASDTKSIPKTPPPFDRDELYRHAKAESYSSLELDDLRKQGYVYKCLGAGIFCLRLAMREFKATQTPSATVLTLRPVFEDLITTLIMQGGDADTNATVAGALVGAFLGFNLLPAHWYEGMQNVDWLLRKTDALIQVVGVDNCSEGYVGSEDQDTRPDGGKEILNREQLEKRERAFMEVYLTKTMEGKKLAAAAQSGSAGQSLMKRWKDVFG